MEDKQSQAAKERTVLSPPPSSDLKCDAEGAEGKRQNCLCAPTTHAGSFRCRLHRKPPASPFSSQLAAKRGASAQKVSCPKVKLALQHKTKQGCSRKMSSSSCSSFSRLEQELPKLSRLSRTSVVDDQNQSSSPDQEALTMLWKAPSTADSRVEAIESVDKVATLDARGEELASLEDKRYMRPLVKLPSI